MSFIHIVNHTKYVIYKDSAVLLTLLQPNEKVSTNFSWTKQGPPSVFYPSPNHPQQQSIIVHTDQKDVVSQISHSILSLIFLLKLDTKVKLLYPHDPL